MDFKVMKASKKDYYFTEEQTNYIINQYLSDVTTNELGQLFEVSYKTIARLLNRNGIELTGVGKRKYNLDQEYFDKIDTPNKAYILGFLFADGCNFPPKQTISMSLQEEDKDILEKIRKEINVERPLEFIDYSNKHDFGYTYKNQYRLLMFSKHMCETLSAIGMVKNKSLVLKFPKMSEELLSHFIRGYFDGDGTVNSNVFNITSTKGFCLSAKEIFENKVGINDIKICEASCHNGVTYVLYICKKDEIKKILDWIYEDAELFLERKYEKYLDNFCFAV